MLDAVGRLGTLRTLRARVRDTGASTLHRLGMTRPRRVCQGRLAIVTFHRVLPAELRDRYPYFGLAVTPEELSWFLGYFAREFRLATLGEAYAAFSADPHGSPPLLAVTFDDGQLDNHAHALPVLRAHGVRATFYLPVEPIRNHQLIWHDRLGFALLDAFAAGPAARGELTRLLAPLGEAGARALAARDRTAQLLELAQACKALAAGAREQLIAALEQRYPGAEDRRWAGPMSFDHARELAAEGHEIGSHSMSHPFLTRCGDAELEHELSESRRVLEQEVGRPVSSFCYPDGNCDPRTEQAARRAGYTTAVTTRWGHNPPNASPCALRRCDMTARHARSADGSFSEALLALRMSGLQPGL